MKNQIENFKQHLISLSKSQNTIRNYTSDVEQYFKYYDVINRDNILEYKEKMFDEFGYSAKTINCKLTSLKSFNEFLLENGKINKIYIIKNDFIKIQSGSNPTDITNKQVKMFLDRVATKQTMYKIRNIALINLIAHTGIRREESCNIKLRDLDLENGELIIAKGKGNKQREVILNNGIINYIKDYLEFRKGMEYSDSPYLFISERGNKLHEDSINLIFNFYCDDKLRITPHMLRHAYATTSIEKGTLTLPQLQNQLGHSSLAVTSIYAQARKCDMKRKINELDVNMFY